MPANTPLPVRQSNVHLTITLLLVGFHIVVIASSNYLVQLPFVLLGFHTTWGAFTFPFVYLASDLTVRVYGASLARKIISLVMLPALAISYVVSVLFYQAEFKGFAELATFNLLVARIALASFSAYVVAQLMDVGVFNRLRRGRHWWLAPGASSVAGNALDTAVFFFVAFYQSSDPFMARHWPEIACVDFAFKLLFSLLLMLPLYGLLLKFVQRRLSISNKLNTRV